MKIGGRSGKVLLHSLILLYQKLLLADANAQNEMRNEDEFVVPSFSKRSNFEVKF